MKERVLLVPLALLLAVSLLVAGCPAPASLVEPPPGPDEVELTMWSAWSPDKWTADPFMHWFIDRVNERGKDVNLSIRFVGGPEVFPAFEGIEAVRKGVVDMGFTAAPYHVGVVPEADAMKLSALRPWEERDSGAHDLMNQFHQKRANVYYLFRLGLDGYFQLYLNVLRETPDLTGLKIRSTAIYDPLVKALGGVPLRIAPPEVYTSLDLGVVDGYGWVAVRIADRKWEEVTRYIWGPRFYTAPTGVFVNLDAWNNLHEEQRALLTTIGREMERDSADYWDELLEEDRALLLDLGLQEIRFTPEEEEWFIGLAHEAGWELLIEEAPDAAKLKPLMTR